MNNTNMHLEVGKTYYQVIKVFRGKIKSMAKKLKLEVKKGK